MAFFSIEDASFWGRDMDRMAAIDKEGGIEGIALANFVLGDAKDNAPVATVLRMAPGYVLPRHGHNCHRFEAVIQGDITVGDRNYGVGTIMVSEPGSLYGPHIAGPEGCTTVEIFSTFDASHKTLVEGSSGVVECDIATPDGAKQMMEHVRQQRAEISA